MEREALARTIQIDCSKGSWLQRTKRLGETALVPHSGSGYAASAFRWSHDGRRRGPGHLLKAPPLVGGRERKRHRSLSLRRRCWPKTQTTAAQRSRGLACSQRCRH